MVHRSHYAHRQRRGQFCLANGKIPYIALVRYAGGNGLGGIHDAAAAYAQDKVRAHFARHLDALMHLAQPGVGHHATQAFCFKPLGLKRLLRTAQKPIFFHTVAAIYDQRLFCLGKLRRLGA